MTYTDTLNVEHPLYGISIEEYVELMDGYLEWINDVDLGGC